jgi:hypothetical protein
MSKIILDVEGKKEEYDDPEKLFREMDKKNGIQISVCVLEKKVFEIYYHDKDFVSVVVFAHTNFPRRKKWKVISNMYKQKGHGFSPRLVTITSDKRIYFSCSRTKDFGPLMIFPETKNYVKMLTDESEKINFPIVREKLFFRGKEIFSFKDIPSQFFISADENKIDVDYRIGYNLRPRLFKPAKNTDKNFTITFNDLVCGYKKSSYYTIMDSLFRLEKDKSDEYELYNYSIFRGDNRLELYNIRFVSQDLLDENFVKTKNDTIVSLIDAWKTGKWNY